MCRNTVRGTDSMTTPRLTQFHRPPAVVVLIVYFAASRNLYQYGVCIVQMLVRGALFFGCGRYTRMKKYHAIGVSESYSYMIHEF